MARHHHKLRDFLEDAEITEDNHASMSRSITAGVDAQIKVINAERKAANPTPRKAIRRLMTCLT